MPVDSVVQVAQAIGVVLAALGLSAGPWIIALLAGKLLTAKAHEARVSDLKEQRDKAEARATVEHSRAEIERKRADDLASKLAEVAGEMGRTTVHLLQGIPPMAPPEGGDSGG